jgi:hypothetical protein
VLELTPQQIERFWSKVEKTDVCWIWKGWLNHHGYGMFDVAKGVKKFAHRIAYEICVGPIPEGMTIDHVREKCSSRACTNPEHLRVVTRGENVLAGDTLAAANAAKTHCPQGHPLSGGNLYVCPKGKRGCRICRNEASRRSQARRSRRKEMV